MLKSIIFALVLFGISEAAIAQKYVFYLHGKIVEDQGANASNTAYGKYEYDNILAKFREAHFTVLSECRKPNTDVKEYAHKVVSQIDSLLKAGVQPGNITVVGASKGALIAMYVSTYLDNQHVNFAFLSSCNDYVFTSCPDIAFCGNILSIYEKSDEGNQSCDKFKTGSKRPMPHYKEIEVNTGLHHGYLYKPIPEWMGPAIKWANGDYK
jgi:hypothetical protein